MKVTSEESDDLERSQEKIDERSRFRELRKKSKYRDKKMSRLSK